MRVVLIGPNGFVGSAFRRRLEIDPEVELVPVTRTSGAEGDCDLLIDCGGNSRKYLADEDPVADFDASATHCLRSLQRFPGKRVLHISTVDVYPDLGDRRRTAESEEIDPARCSRYGLHRFLAEQIVRHYASDWVILRLAGMVGPRLRKNPVFDILNQRPLRIHPDSLYQFMHTDDVAAAALVLARQAESGAIFNLCGAGLVSPREIAELAGCSLDLSALPPDAAPRIVDVNNDLVRTRVPIAESLTTVARFVAVERGVPLLH